MADFPFDIVGLDLDGTLLETYRDLGTAVNHALAAGGFATVSLEHARDLIGGGAKAMLQKAIAEQGGLDPDQFHGLYKKLLAFYGENYAVHTQPFPGTLEALDDLAARGVRVAVVTNKFETFAVGILEALGMMDRFECVVGGDTLGKGKAKPEPDLLLEAQRRCGGGRMAYAGDSSYDLRAARKAGLPFVAACYGYCDLDPAEMGETRIDSMGELVPALESLAPDATA